MNEVHLVGVAKSSWTYDGNLYVRISVARDAGRPGRPPTEGGNFDYITLVFPDGARQGIQIRQGQQVSAHGWLQSRDVHESLADFMRRAERNGESALAKAVGRALQDVSGWEDVQVHRAMTEVIVERWSVGD